MTMKANRMIVAATALALSISDLFNRATFARQRREFDPYTHRRHGRGTPEWVHCRQCENYVSGRKKHRCRAPYIPAPRHGWRYQNGNLVRRNES